MLTTRSTANATVRLFWQAALRHRKLLYVAGLHSIGAVFVFMICPLLIGKILASLAQPNGDPWQYVPYLVAAATIGVIANRIGFQSLMEHQARTMGFLQNQAVETLLRRSVGFHNNTMGGKLVSDAIDYPQGYSMLCGAFFNTLVPFTITLLSGIVIVFIESWVLGLVIVVMTAGTIGAGILDSMRRSSLRQRRLKATKEVTGHIADTIMNVQTVKTFAREAEELRESHKRSNALMELRVSDWKQAGSNGNRRMAILLGMQIGFVLVIIHLMQGDPALLGIGIFAFSFSVLLITRLFEINIVLRQIEDGLLQAAPLTEILQGQPEITDAPDAKPLVVSKAAIRLNDVQFRYADSAKADHVFASLTLNLAPGEKIGLVGPSGGGKSTLTRLLLRFDDINSGEISIDGQNIAEVTQRSLRENIAYVPQEPLLFHRSIRDNIAYGKNAVSDNDIIAAATSAHAHEFIQELPSGYDTIVGERGVKLSGGQRQRIAIARAVLKNAPILILDEATSALDSESEVLIQQALWKLMQGRTTLVIAHRLSTIQKMDRIVVLENGALTEQGSHAELLANKGTYARLWAHQSGGFLED
jgi:ATP-binding cassette subfamily B protein